MKIEGKTFQGETINIEDHEYVRCNFHNCRFVYRGEAGKSSMAGCFFDAPKWVFEGAALRTIGFLRDMYRLGGEMGADFAATAISAIVGQKVALKPLQSTNLTVDQPPIPCPQCKGSGSCDCAPPPAGVTPTAPCAKCGGTNQCSGCGGSGRAPAGFTV